MKTIKYFYLILVAFVIGNASLSRAAVTNSSIPLSQTGKKLEANYTGMLGQLRTELTAKLPDPAKPDQVNAFLNSDALDAKLAKFAVLHEATPRGLAEFAQQGKEQAAMIDQLLADADLMKRMLVADGASEGKYGQVMQMYSDIRKASSKASSGVLERLALAVALEHAAPIAQENPKASTTAPATVDPVKRYLHYEKAFLNRELDPAFEKLSDWELRYVVCAPEADEALTWGREMLRNLRPDHIRTLDEGWRYANVVNTDVRYGSLDVRNDRPELSNVQNILMNGGICGRRAFFARYICRAFGIPATARPSTGHGASARWSPKGWVVVLGPSWGSGTTTTRYRNDLDFLATTQARTKPDDFLKVKRAYWAGDVMGETRHYGEHDKPSTAARWSDVALATQKQIIEAAKSVALPALGAELGEATGSTTGEATSTATITPEDRKITVGAGGMITIPAAANIQAKGGSKDEDEATNDVFAMKSFEGGSQVFMPHFSQQKPVLVRGGSFRHDASQSESATRHWRGSRPKKSQDLRGFRLAVTPDGDKPQKEMKVDLGNGVTMDFILIPPGKFIMGGDRKAREGEVLSDTPKHEVTLTEAFYLGKHEVTQAQYQAISNKKPSEGPDHPADGVKPFTALQFCDDLSARIGLDFRLPTEAEWEYAARAGTSTRWSFGDDPSKLGEYAWFKDNAGGKTHPVGQKKTNSWGLHDMYGNVAEFVRDEHEEGYYAQGSKVDPTGPSLGIHSSIQYTIDVPQAGTYKLTAKVVTSNVDQSLQVAVNGAGSPTTIALPFTIGMWGESKPVAVTLKQGTNTLHFWRDQAPQYGVAIKSFTLQP